MSAIKLKGWNIPKQKHEKDQKAAKKEAKAWAQKAMNSDRRTQLSRKLHCVLEC